MTTTYNKPSVKMLKVTLTRNVGTWYCDQCCSQGTTVYGEPCRFCDGQGQAPYEEIVHMEISKEDLEVLAQWLKSPEGVKVHLE